MLKGFVPVLLASSFSDSYFFLTLVALAAVCGHMFSVFLHGKGGKGVATWVGAFVAISTSGTIICGLAFLAALYFYNFVSLASLVMVALMPVVLLFQGLFGAIPVALVLMGPSSGSTRKTSSASWPVRNIPGRRKNSLFSAPSPLV